jgi:hypothetical protein
LGLQRLEGAARRGVQPLALPFIEPAAGHVLRQRVLEHVRRPRLEILEIEELQPHEAVEHAGEIHRLALRRGHQPERPPARRRGHGQRMLSADNW